MQLFRLMSPLLMVLLTTSVWAVDTARLFTDLDRDHDGKLVVSEISAEHRRLYARLLRTADADRDGKLTPAEFRTGLKPQTPAKPMVRKQGSELPGTDALLLLLAKMDANGNGTIEAKEVPAKFRALFERMEELPVGNPDGVLDRRELTQAAPRLSQIALRNAERMDLDVELELALLPNKQWQAVQNMLGPRPRGALRTNPGQVRALFGRLDADGDGQISRTEAPRRLADRFDRVDANGNGRLEREEVARMLALLSRPLKRTRPGVESAPNMQRPQ